jgi:G3E family GTPase
MSGSLGAGNGPPLNHELANRRGLRAAVSTIDKCEVNIDTCLLDRGVADASPPSLTTRWRA